MQIVYNGYTISDAMFFGKFFIQESYTEISFNCTFLIKAASEAALVAACTAAEDALRVRNKNLAITFGATSEYSFSHSANTGFLAQPSISKLPNEFSTRLSRAYKFSLTMQRPADESGYDYRQSAQISVSQNIKGRKTVSISGKYTAGGSNSALENYNTYAATWADSIAQAILGTAKYEILDNSYSYDQENKVLSFTKTYQQKLDLAVTYNSYAIPTTYNNFNVSETYEGFTFSCEFSISHTDADDAETDLRMWNCALTVAFDGSTVYSINPATNTGFLCQPSLNLISNTTDDDTLRFYRFSVSCQLPASKSGYGYRRSGSYSISYAPTRKKTVSFSVVYTAGGANSAFQNYTAGAKTWAAGILTAIGGTYELISERPAPDMENKILNASLVYDEILSNQDSSQLNNPKIVLGQCDYSIQLAQEIGISPTGGYATITPSVVVTLNYSAQIDKEQASSETDIEETYRTAVRPWIIAHARDVLGLANKTQVGTGYIVQGENYRINPSTYAVSGSISFSAPRSLDQIIEISESLQKQITLGLVPRKIWDGKRATYNVYNLGSEERLTRVIKVMQLNSEPITPSPFPGNYLLLSRRESKEVRKIGVGSTGTSLNDRLLYVKTFVEDYLFVDLQV